jgi:hypothetical protein
LILSDPESHAINALPEYAIEAAVAAATFDQIREFWLEEVNIVAVTNVDKTKEVRGNRSKLDALPGALAQIALIGAPAGLIALFCGVLNVSAQATAAVSLLSVVLTTNCIYRKRINRLIPSSLLTALIVGLSTIFFLNYQDILLKDTGLIKWYKHSNDYLAEIDQQIDASQQEIWFFGTDFNISAGERRDALLKKLAAGLKIRFLIFDPKSTHLPDLAADFDQNSDELKAECEKSLDDLIELQNRWQGLEKQTPTPGELEIRVFDTHPHARIYVFDPQRSQGRTYFIPYINALNSVDSPGYLLHNSQSGIFSHYFAGIQKLWSTSETLDQHTNNPAPVH